MQWKSAAYIALFVLLFEEDKLDANETALAAAELVNRALKPFRATNTSDIVLLIIKQESVLASAEYIRCNLYSQVKINFG